MDFRSDNVASVAPEIVDAMIEAARVSAAPYGGDPITEGLEPAFSALFETPVRVFPVVTGTAANALAIAAFTPPYGVVYAARAAHVENDECGAPEFMSGGAKVVGVENGSARSCRPRSKPRSPPPARAKCIGLSRLASA